VISLASVRTEDDQAMVSRASDPLAATASRDVAAQAFTMRLSNLFADVTADDLGRTVTTALRMLAEYADIDVAYAVLVERDVIVDVWEWARPRTPTSPPEVGASVDQWFGPAGQMMRRGMAIPITDVRLLPMDDGMSARFGRTDIRSLVMVPIRKQDALAGVVGFATSGRVRDWQDRTIRELDVFGDILLTAVLRVRYRASLALADIRMRRIAELVPDALLFVGDDERITWASRSAALVLDRTPEHLLGRRPTDLVHPDDAETVRETARQVRCGVVRPPLRCRVRMGADDYRWCEVSLSFAADDPGDTTPPEMLVTVRDVHESRLEVERLASSASTDHLTGALNRTGLHDLLGSLASAGRPLALAFCDLDGFKQVNDRFGHHTGDAVLVDVAARLRRASRPSDALARLGGDEFVVVLPGVSDGGLAGRLAERLVRAIAGKDGVMTLTTTAEPRELPLSLSVGVALSGPGLTTHELLRMADTAMYEAKRRGKNCWAGVPA
jgi:diguanylate cyclase (GGDEF)-like protein/PAS domain S-box-containing protein